MRDDEASVRKSSSTVKVHRQCEFQNAIAS
jgi:hypothetical protein